MALFYFIFLLFLLQAHEESKALNSNEVKKHQPCGHKVFIKYVHKFKNQKNRRRKSYIANCGSAAFSRKFEY